MSYSCPCKTGSMTSQISQQNQMQMVHHHTFLLERKYVWNSLRVQSEACHPTLRKTNERWKESRCDPSLFTAPCPFWFFASNFLWIFYGIFMYILVHTYVVLCVCVCIYIHVTYIYIYIHACVERERERLAVSLAPSLSSFSLLYTQHVQYVLFCVPIIGSCIQMELGYGSHVQFSIISLP